MSRPARSFVLAGALLSLTACCATPVTPPSPTRAGPPEADVVIARFEDGSGAADGEAIAAALRLELAERLAWARGIAFVAPIEAHGASPEVTAATDAIVRGRWTGDTLELVVETPAGKVLMHERAPPDRLDGAAERVARTIGLTLDAAGLSLPPPRDRASLGAALVGLERARAAGRAPDPLRASPLPDDAWSLWMQGLAAAFAGDAELARRHLEQATRLTPDLLGARFSWAHTEMPEVDRVRLLGELVRASPRLPLFVDTMREAVSTGIEARRSAIEPLSLAVRRYAPTPEQQAALDAIETLWALGERLPFEALHRKDLLVDVAASELLIGSASAAERHLAELRALGGSRERDSLVPALGALVREALGRQTTTGHPVALYEARDYASSESADLGARDCSGASILIMAAERGDAAVVTGLLARGADALAANLRGQTALHRAAWLGHPGVVRALMASGDEARREAMDDHGRTPLMLAVEGDQPEVAALLLDAGARTDAIDRDAESAIVIAGRLGRARLVPLLVRANADIGARDRSGRTALELTIVHGHAAALDALVNAGARVELRHLELGARSGRVDIMDRLLAGTRKSDMPGASLDSVLAAALAADDPAMVDHLVGAGLAPPRGKSLIEAAVEAGAQRVVKARLTPEARRARGAFGLRLVELALVQTTPDWQMVKLLVEADDVAALAWLGLIPELKAALDRDPGAVTRLGADGLGAIHHAVRAAQVDAINLLIERGAPPGLAAATSIAYAPEIAGWTPLHFAFAVARPDVVVLLLAKGARLDAADARGRKAGQLVHLPWLEDEGFDRIKEAEKFIADDEARSILAELEQDDVISAPRPRLVLGSAYIPGEGVAGAGRGVRFAADGDGFGFGGRGIQLPIRIADTSILVRSDVDHETDADLGSAGLETMLLRCYNHAAWPEARRVARDLVRARDDEGASEMVKGLAHQNLGVIEVRNGDLQAAAPHFTIASEAFARADAPQHVALLAAILENRSELAWRAERWQEAIDDLRRAVGLREGYAQDPKLLPVPWLLLGTVYSEWGRYKDAVDATTKGLKFAEVSWGKNHHVTILARGNLAVLLDALGDRQRAKKLIMDQVTLLEAWGEAADPVQLAVARANAAMFLAREGDTRAASDRIVAAIEGLHRHDPNHFLLGRILIVAGDIAGVSDPAVAEDAYRRAIDRLAAAYGPRTGVVAGAMRRLAMTIGVRDPEQGMTLLMESWVIASEADSPEERWPIEIELGRVAAAQGRMPTAIFFGKQAVATLERVRGDARGVGAVLEKSLVESRIAVWHLLADWLVGESRLEEATRVLALLKDDEERSLVTRGGKEHGASAGQAVPRTPTEVRIKAAADAQADELARAGSELEELAAIKRTKGLDAPGEKRLEKARDTVREARKRFEQFLRDIEGELARMDADRAAEVGAMNLRDVSSLQGTLKELGHGAVLVHYLVVDDKLRIIVTTSGLQIGRASNVSARDLNALVFRFRQALADPRSDPRPLGQELFTLLVAPIEQDLRQAKAETLMVALDGALRYIPLSALWDGERWLVERFRIALFSRAGLDKLTTKPTAAARIAGLGVGKKIEGHSQLKEVPRELEGIVRRDASDPDGVLPGALWMDDAFRHDTLGALLETRTFTAIHIASHFVFEPGTEADSYLLLGDGGKLTLEDIHYELRFDGIDLLSLSACNTAVGGSGGEGREIEGFAALTQRLGARGVLATLWPVADRSTGELMRSLYTIVGAGAGDVTKADALRQAQLKFIRNKETLDASDLAPRGPRPLVAPPAEGAAPGPPPSPAPPPVDRTHPYYWAPFVLIGNWL